ncbi:MAG: zinc-ribbon domain-containing protein, partial [Firmicutes bacterium]|nr:zinc-ribbon domain-containing protein [Bacillota bacterium]
MKCPNCGFENAEGARFCRKCGTPIVNLTGNQAPQQRQASQ